MEIVWISRRWNTEARGKNPQMIPPIQIGPISAKAMSEPIVDRAVRLMKDEELWQ
jgi:hypothetical protein